MPEPEKLPDESTRTDDADALLAQWSEGQPQRASLIVLAGWELGQEFQLSEDEHILGRAPTATLSFSLPSLARHHARIRRVCDEESTCFELEDLGGGAYVNNEPVSRVRLRNGDKIKVGGVLLKFVLHDPVDALFYREIHRRIHYDQQTGLLTMEAFRRVLEAQLAKYPPDPQFCVAMTDLDGLKRINDTHGHSAGQYTVSTMGRLIRDSLRAQDRAGLFGGDESVILYPGATLEEAREIAEDIRTTIAGHRFEHRGVPFQVTITQGLAEWPDDGHTADELLAAADRALYAAKAAGRNCVRAASEI